MKVLFLAMSPHGFGETLMGLAVADAIRDIGIDSFFVVEPGGESLVRRSGHPFEVVRPGMGRLMELLVDDVVRVERPDVIVLADYWVHVGVVTRRYGMDPWFIDKYDLPVLPIDIWEWEKTDFQIDLVGRSHYAVDPRFLTMPAALRPVPLAHPSPDGSGKSLPFRMFADEEPMSRRTRGHLRTTFGLPESDRIVFMATAQWQHGADATYRAAVRPLQEGVPLLLRSLLSELGEGTRFLFVGAVPDAFRGLPADRCIVMPPCAPGRFRHLLGMADLVLSMNVAATTVGRALLAGIPALVLTNRHEVSSQGDIERVEAQVGPLSPTWHQVLTEHLPWHPYRMWPLGFHSFLDPILADNPFTRCVVQREVLDERGCQSTLQNLLFDDATRQDIAAAQADYRRQLDEIPPTSTVFAAAVAAVGGREVPIP